MYKWSQVDQPLPLDIPERPRKCVCSDPNYYHGDMTINLEDGHIVCITCLGKIT